MNTLQGEWQALRQEVEQRLAFGNRNARRFRNLHITLVLSTLVCGILATALAADSAFDTRTVAAALAEAGTGVEPGELPRGWKIVCGVIAAITLLGTFTQGAHSLLKIAEHQSKALTCAGKLDAIALQLTQMHPDSITAAREELGRVLKEYPEYVR